MGLTSSQKRKIRKRIRKWARDQKRKSSSSRSSGGASAADRQAAIDRSNAAAVSWGGTASATGGSVPSSSGGGSSSSGSFSSGGNDIMYRNDDQQTLSEGGSGANSIRNRDFSSINSAAPTPVLSLSQSQGLAKEYGLGGIADDQFSGLTRADAQKKAESIKSGKLKDVTALSSDIYNPQAIANTKKKFNDLIFKINEIENTPFETGQTKKEKRASIIDAFGKEIGGLFNSPEELKASLQTPEFQNYLRQYEQLGGSQSLIESNVNQLQFGENLGEQTIDQYLGIPDTQAEQMALNSLIPEKQVLQDQISFEASIPQEYADAYWGTEDQIGFQEKEEQLAEESIKLIERKAKQESENAKAQAELASERYDFEQKKAKATTEKNRLAAKNYMTNHLAKLGALKTTGKAGEALVKLEADYQTQAQNIDMEYSFAKKELDNTLTETLTSIEQQRDDAILGIKEDLSKSEEEVWREVAKLQQTAQRNIFKLADGFAKDYRTQTDKYRKELEKAAKEYTDNFANTITDGDISQFGEGDFVFKTNAKGKRIEGGILRPGGDITDVESFLEETAGSDGYVNSERLMEAYEAYVASGGNRTDFLKMVKVNQYANPEDTSLPTWLRFGSSSRAEAPDEDEDEGKSARQIAKEEKAAREAEEEDDEG